MIQHRLLLELDRVASRYRRLRFWQALAVLWLVAACATLVVWFLRLDTAGMLRLSIPLLCGIAAVLAGLSLWFASATTRNLLWVARQIEAAFPELGTGLLAAIEQRPNLPDGRFGYLQSSVIRQALVHADGHAWPQIVSTRRITGAVLANFTALGIFIAVLASLSFTGSSGSAASLIPGPESLPPGSRFAITVEPGDTEIERGTSLLVLARVEGSIPLEATLVYEPRDGEATHLAMSRSLEDPVFGARIPVVEQDLEYRVEMGGEATPTYRVTVFEYPRLDRADARLVYPSYTGLEERLVQDVRTVSVVEGTELTLICYLNKPVASAVLLEDDFPPISLTPVAGEPSRYQATIRCEQSRRMTLKLVDDKGRENVKPAEFRIKVLPNQPPTLKPTFPARDLAVSPLEEMDVKATVWDDFGLQRFGLTYSLAGQEPVEIELGSRAIAKQKQEAAHIIRFEDLQAEPDQLLSYHFWAEDFAPDGSLRRTLSDMYFAEVRPFEEIFRQGQQPPGGQSQQQQQQQGGQNAQAAEQLAELQKEIINATWKLVRRETGPKLTDKFAADAELIAVSQGSALEQASELAQRVQDPESQEHVATVMQAMQQAVKHLEDAHLTPASHPLQPALTAEQAAYQALLKLRAREHRVVRGSQQSSGSRSSSSSRSQQQLQQLELTNEENRYETQRMAQSQSEQEDRETRQVLNRLKELARRQHDLNERLKELQTALQEAQTEQEREELRRQLKRLQEEQREILRDTDELKSRMETPENLERMAEQRDQLEQTRDQVRRASEALEQEMVSQAAASGTRAERDFEELRDEFRRRASGQFSEEMRQMRDAARQLDEKQQELSERLAEVANPTNQSKSLRDDGETERIASELSEQRQRLSQLQEQMRQTIQEAEETEPLLSERLYDTVRKTLDSNPEQALEAAERSLRQGFPEDARQQEQPARRGISELREGIEHAAEAVLGDETEALRRAREELEQLADQLNEELARNSPQGEPRDGQPRDGQPRDGQPRDGQPRDGQQRDGQQRDGQPRDGQPRDGQPRDGQPRDGQPRDGQQRDGQPRDRQQSERNGEPSAQRGQQTGERDPNGQPASQQAQSSSNGERSSEQAERSQQSESQPPNGEQNREPSQQDGNQQRGQPQNQPGQQSSGESQQGQNQPQGSSQQGSSSRSGQRSNDDRRDGPRPNRGARRLSDPSGLGGFGPWEDDSESREFAPIAGEDFRDWSDRLRDVEEMVNEPELRAEAARIRERARAIRAEMKRHSEPPNWDLVRMQVAEPLVELRDRVAEEVLRRTSKEALVPLDRDPVPPGYAEKTRRYYERLGSGR